MSHLRTVVLLVILTFTASGYTEHDEQSLDVQKIFHIMRRSARDTAIIMQDLKMASYRQENMDARMDRMDSEIANLNLMMETIVTLL